MSLLYVAAQNKLELLAAKLERQLYMIGACEYRLGLRTELPKFPAPKQAPNHLPHLPPPRQPIWTRDDPQIESARKNRDDDKNNKPPTLLELESLLTDMEKLYATRQERLFTLMIHILKIEQT